MSDLSWLNPTPHAIAVYASRPLSPVATQHSLPSGRYPLLGPDFHRLDRTSLRLAHSLDHLNDPLPRGSSADSGGMSSLATGHAAHRGSRLRRSAFAPSSSPASTIVGSGYPQFSSLRALGLSSGRAHPCPEGTRLTCIRLCIQLSAHPAHLGVLRPP